METREPTASGSLPFSGRLGGVTSLKESIKSDLTAAMKAGDEIAKSTLRMALSAISNAVVADEVAKAAAAGQEGPKAMGGVVKAVRERVGSSADGSLIARLVKAALA